MESKYHEMNAGQDASNVDQSTSPLEPAEAANHGVQRRDFLRHMAAAAAGAGLLSGITVSDLAWAASGGTGPCVFDVNKVYQDELNDKYFKGFTLMLYVYGDIQLIPLFKRPFSKLIPDAMDRVTSAVSLGILPDDKRKCINESLSAIAKIAPDVTAKQLYLLDGQIDQQTLLNIQDLGKKINECGLILSWPYQIEDHVPEAKMALHDLNHNSLLTALGGETLQRMYLCIKRPSHPKHEHILAVSHGKKGGVFGVRGSRPEHMAAAVATAAIALDGGPTKGNGQVCGASGCESCNLQGCFCSMLEDGSCSLLSDPACNNC